MTSRRFSTRFMWCRTSLANQSSLIVEQGLVRGEDGGRVTARLEDDHADLGPVEAQVEQASSSSRKARRAQRSLPFVRMPAASLGSPASGPFTVRWATRLPASTFSVT